MREDEIETIKKKHRERESEREIGPEFVDDLRWAVMWLTALLKAMLDYDLSVDALPTSAAACDC